MFVNTLRPILFSALVLGSTASAWAEAAPLSALEGALTGGTVNVNLRLRYELVEQDNALEDADALTLRTALGYTTECDSVSYAWYEVGVGSDPAGGGGTTGGGTTGSGTTGGGTPTSQCTGTETSWTGSLSGTGDQAIEPGGTYASYTAPSGALYGDSGTDFDLYLYKWHKKRGWTLADSSETSTSTEYVSSSASGDFYFIAYSYSGSGDYELCIDG